MRKKLCVFLCAIMILFTVGCENKSNKKLVEHLNFRFNDIEAEYSEVYDPKDGNYTDGAEKYSYKINKAIDVTLDDGLKEPFQVYEYKICKYDECETKVDDNYVYIYLTKLLDMYNQEHEDDQLYLNVNTDSLGGKYFVSNSYGGVCICGEKEKSKDITEKLDSFKEFVKSKTKKNISLVISVNCEETIQYNF